MDPLSAVDVETILSGTADWIEPEIAAALAHHPLDSIETEFPHYVREIDSPDGVDRPTELHPVFYGCYDWHSSVHSHWALIRQLRLIDDHPNRSEIIERIDSRFTADNIQREVAYFETHESFEKPYGWAWLLHLTAELSLWEDSTADEWASILDPLEQRILELVQSEFLTQDRPFRVGGHHNSAFALHCLHDYAITTGAGSLATAVGDTAIRFYENDRNYPVEYEPFGWDFLSPALTEANLMQRIYDDEALERWIDTFLPDLTASPFDQILHPAEVSSDPDEGVALHLVGLNVSKAWCLAELADSLEGHRYGPILQQSARDHAERGLEQAFTDSYAGSHWLSSFVLYLLTRNEAGISPG